MTKDFAKTGGTYCTTNDVRGWTTYRPTYKRYYNDGKRDDYPVFGNLAKQISTARQAASLPTEMAVQAVRFRMGM